MTLSCLHMTVHVRCVRCDRVRHCQSSDCNFNELLRGCVPVAQYCTLPSLILFVTLLLFHPVSSESVGYRFTDCAKCIFQSEKCYVTVLSSYLNLKRNANE